MGLTGIRLLHREAKGAVHGEQGFIKVPVPKKTTVHSSALHDAFGRPVYRKDAAV